MQVDPNMSVDLRLGADLLVLGAGMAGMTAAAYAATRGAQVIVVEKADKVGGSAALSGGFFWVFNSFEALRREVPLGDPTLGRVLLQRFSDGVEWIRSIGVQISASVAPRPIPDATGHLIDILGYLDRCRRLVIDNGGHVITNARVDRLELRDKQVVGATIADRDGTTQVHAPWTVLATGGFQADQELVRRYIGEQASQILVRSNPNSTGDGLRLGLSVGASHVGNMRGFYGHLMAYPIYKEFLPSDYLRLAQSLYSPHGILLDKAGNRFTDESLGYFANAQDLAKLPGARAIVIADEQARIDFAIQSPAPGMETVDLVSEAEIEGSHVGRADTLSELSQIVEPWGYDAQGVRDTVTNFNRLVSHSASSLIPHRRRYHRPLTTAPFFAVEVQPAITFTHGGLRINAEAQVIDASGTPISGLLAAGVDGAGVHNFGYAGGLSVAAIFAMQAVDTAMRQP